MLKLISILFLAALPALPQIAIPTHRYNNARTGANLSETTLNTSNVNPAQFGQLYTYPVDGQVYAMPLYIPAVPVSGQGTHNVLYVATMNNSLYAFDADSNGSPLWTRNYNNAAADVTPIPATDVQVLSDIIGPIGILSTPVIDTATSIVYFVVHTKENGSYVQRIHAVDIRSGAEIPGSPTLIAGTITNSSGAQVSFDPMKENQRSALALANGLIYIAWGSHNDIDPYHGWVMAYSAYTSQTGTGLQQKWVFNSTPDGGEGGIWQAGSPPAIDTSGNLYYGVGNGDWNGSTNVGQSVLKLSPSLNLSDYFTPDNWSVESNEDMDLGCGGLMLLPGTNLLVEGSKQGILYVLNTSQMGHLVSGNTQITQLFQAGNGHIHGGTVYWKSPTHGPLVYIWSENDYAKAFHFNGTTFDTTPLSESLVEDPIGGMPGGFLTISANGSTAGSGILWANVPYSGDANHNTVPGILRAFDADNLSNELWNTRMNASRDDFGNFAKNVPPVVVNGRVYMATFSNTIAVYGLLPAPPPGLSETLSSSTLSVSTGASASINVFVSASSGPINLTASGLPSGVTAQFTPASLTGSGSSTLTFTAASSAAAGLSNITVTATAGSYTATQQLALTVTQATTPVIQINAGGGAAGTFVADTDVSGGTAAGSSNTIDTSQVTNPAPQAVYQTERWGVFTYTIPNLTAGSSYTVRLHFADFYFSAAGQRIFSVAINGTTVLQNFDIVAAAGGQNRAIAEQFNVNANSSGQIIISFVKGSADYPKVSGIEVLAPSGATTPPPPPPANSVQINSGGGATGTFLADTDVSGGSTSSTSKAIDTSLVTNPAPQAVYQFERYGAFTYTVPNLTAGASYTVRLDFAEIYWTSPGQRVFNVAINGTAVLQNFDIVATAGSAFKAIAEQFNATANTNGQIVIAFTAGSADLPKLSGLEIAAGSSSTPPPPPPPSTTVDINSGGNSTGSFSADTDFSGGLTASTSNTIDTSLVTNPPPQAVYQSERYGSFSYTIPNLTAGSHYTVRLHFAEIYWTSPGQRVFNVSINGTPVLQNFDIITAAGAPFKAIAEPFTATANASGQIVITFSNGSADLPKLSGLEVF